MLTGFQRVCLYIISHLILTKILLLSFNKWWNIGQEKLKWFFQGHSCDKRPCLVVFPTNCMILVLGSTFWKGSYCQTTPRADWESKSYAKTEYFLDPMKTFKKSASKEHFTCYQSFHLKRKSFFKICFQWLLSTWSFYWSFVHHYVTPIILGPPTTTTRFQLEP